MERGHRGQGRLRNGAWTGVCLGWVALSVYAASPYVALWRVGVALHHHNIDALRSAVDWNRVRAGLEQELGGSGNVATVKSVSAESDDELPEFGASFAKRAITNVVDEDCDPEHVDAMLAHEPADGSGAIAEARKMLAWAFFTGPETFQALLRISDDPHAAPVRVSMAFTRRHGWRVTNVWLPQTMLSRPEQNAT